MPEKTDAPPSTPEWNTRFVVQHFEDFVNKRDLDAIDRNVHADFLDHDGPGGMDADRVATVTPLHEATARDLAR